jgi:hypothetical protein
VKKTHSIFTHLPKEAEKKTHPRSLPGTKSAKENRKKATASNDNDE